jgi:hypothetical protein
MELCRAPLFATPITSARADKQQLQLLMSTTLLVSLTPRSIIEPGSLIMPIPLSKAYEIIHLNIFEAGRRMPQDVKESLYLALDALQLIMALRHAGIAAAFVPLDHEEGFKPPPVNHKDNPTAPSDDPALT